jgi:3,5-epimerase/4-reductase
MRIVFFGAKGWIASYFVPLLKERGHEILEPTLRADDTWNIYRMLENFGRVDRVVSFIGRTHGDGIPTIDYLEQPGKLVENMRDNLYAPVSLALICRDLGLHFTYLGTGCIFSDDDPKSVSYSEDAEPNFFGSSYSTVKGYTDRLMHLVEDTALNVRIRMPITSDMAPRNFITKIVNYAKICSIPNSMSVLDTLFPVLIQLIEQGTTGTVNLVNPGLITHDEILTMYREIVDPDKTWENMTIEDQDQMLASKRSNNQLSTMWMRNNHPNVPNIHDAVRMCLRMSISRDEEILEINKIKHQKDDHAKSPFANASAQHVVSLECDREKEMEDKNVQK